MPRISCDVAVRAQPAMGGIVPAGDTGVEALDTAKGHHAVNNQYQIKSQVNRATQQVTWCKTGKQAQKVWPLFLQLEEPARCWFLPRD